MAFRSVSGNVSAAATVVVTKPTGIIKGDILIAHCASYRSTSAAPTLATIANTGGSGGAAWNTVVSQTTGTYYKSAYAWKLATTDGDGTVVSYTWSATNAARMSAEVIVISGRKAAAPTPISNTAYTTTDTIIRAADITAALHDDVVWAGFNYRSTVQASVMPSGFTNGITETAGAAIGSDIAYLLDVAAGALGNKDGSMANAVATKHAFMFCLPRQILPTVSSLDVTHGPASGGTAVTITGTGFYGATGVTFGGSAATSVAVVSDTSITCVTPAHASETNVQTCVTGPGGSSADVAGDNYTFDFITLTAASTLTGFVTSGGAGGTFGYTTAGGSGDYGFAAGVNRVVLGKFTLSEACTVSMLTLSLSNNTTVDHCKGVIYDDDGAGGYPATLLGVGSEITIPAASGQTWYNSTFASGIVLAAGNYWLGEINPAASPGDGSFWSTAAAGTSGYTDLASYASPPAIASWPNPNTYKMSVYATYTTGSAGAISWTAAPAKTITAASTLTGFTAGAAAISWTAGGATTTLTAASTLTAFTAAAAALSWTAAPAKTLTAASTLTGFTAGTAAVSWTAAPAKTITAASTLTGFTAGAASLSWTAATPTTLTASSTLTAFTAGSASISAITPTALTAASTLTGFTAASAALSWSAATPTTMTASSSLTGFTAGAAAVSWTAAPARTLTAASTLTAFTAGAAALSWTAAPAKTLTAASTLTGFTAGTAAISWTAAPAKTLTAASTLTGMLAGAASLDNTAAGGTSLTAASTLTAFTNASASLSWTAATAVTMTAASTLTAYVSASADLANTAPAVTTLTAASTLTAYVSASASVQWSTAVTLTGSSTLTGVLSGQAALLFLGRDIAFTITVVGNRWTACHIGRQWSAEMQLRAWNAHLEPDGWQAETNPSGWTAAVRRDE